MTTTSSGQGCEQEGLLVESGPQLSTVLSNGEAAAMCFGRSWPIRANSLVQTMLGLLKVT